MNASASTGVGREGPFRSGDQSAIRPRRLRTTPVLRSLVGETKLSLCDLVAPLFVRETIDAPVPIESLPGHFHHTVTSLIEETEQLCDLGIRGVMVFGIPELSKKDSKGSQASTPGGIVQVALDALRKRFGDQVVLFSDLCLDEYTVHGHCGVLKNPKPASTPIDEEATLVRYGQIAIAQAVAGAHVVAPSGMMDGQVRAIRQALDQGGYLDVGILSYSAKYASGLYGPFRQAACVEIGPGGDRRGYQMDPKNADEALREIALDIEEGADMVMVKPAGPYGDIISKANAAMGVLMAPVPIAGYQVSGEYAMVKAATERGWIDGEAVAAELVVSIKRAGANFVLTYFAKELADAINRGRILS